LRRAIGFARDWTHDHKRRTTRRASLQARRLPGDRTTFNQRRGHPDGSVWQQGVGKVEKAMHERKRGTLKSGRSGKTVKSKKQAIAIGLSEARQAGGKVPAKKNGAAKKAGGARKSTAKKAGARKSTARKSTARKSAARKTGARKSASRKTASRRTARKSGARKTARKSLAKRS
jgi:hypothetical protein